MELRQLEYFVAVAEEANFTRAAERVHISQSGVSAQIRALERELGAALIDRSGRTATLTAAGAAALVHARATLASAQAARHAVDEVTGLVRGRVAVGMVAGCTIAPLFDALASLRRARPAIEIALFEDDSAGLIGRVRAGTADLALVGARGGAPTGLESLPIVSERLVAAVPSGHPLAGRSRVSLDELAAFPVVTMPEGTGIRSVFDEACAAKGVRPDVALQAGAPSAVADLAERGLGVAILSESMVSGRAGLEALPLDDVETPAVLALVWSASGSPALRELVVHCRRAFGAPVQQPPALEEP